MNRISKIFENIEEYVLGMSILILALYACVQVFTRYALNFSFTSYEEIGRYTCVFITFLGASLGIKRSSHFAMTAVTDRFPFRTAHFVSALIWIISALFFFVVTYYGVIHCIKQFRFDTISPALRIPMYIPFLPIPAFFTVMGFRSLVKIYEEAALFIKGEDASVNDTENPESPPKRT